MLSGNPSVYLLVTFDLFRSLYPLTALIFDARFSDVFIRLVYLHVNCKQEAAAVVMLVTEVLSLR